MSNYDDVGVTKEFFDDDQGHAGFDQEGRAGVSEIMESNVAKSGLVAEGFDAHGGFLRVDEGADGGGEDVAGFVPEVAGAFALGGGCVDKGGDQQTGLVPMTIDVVEVESPIVVETAKTITTAEADVPGTGLAELLDERAIAKLAARAREQAAAGGLKLLGSDGLLQALTKQIIEAALEAEMDDHLRADARPDPAGGAPAKHNERNGRRGKKTSTEVGPVHVMLPRDQAGSFAPSVVAKSSRRTSVIKEMVTSLIGKCSSRCARWPGVTRWQ